jgi:homoserine kinase
MQKVTVRVPASTSNLGPGFDCLGIALRIHNTIRITRGPAVSLHPPIVSEAADRFFTRIRRRAVSFSYSIVERVPRCRGLGSSAAVRLGTLLGLNRLNGEPLPRASVFELCAELEGHPDNAAPAIFGGFTVTKRDGFPAVRSVTRNRSGPILRFTVQQFAVSPRLHFVLLIPELEIRTSKARGILPEKISRLAAVKNSANACAVTAAFAAQDYEKLHGAFIDHLHQPFRAKLVPFLPNAIAAAERAGALGAFLSGSGSSICAITLKGPDRVAAAMKSAAASISATTIVTKADNRGATCLVINE